MGYYGNLARGVWRFSRATSEASSRSIAQWDLRRTLRASAGKAASGVLAPGDGSPPPSGPTDFYDYRGVATPAELRGLEEGPYELGRLIDVRKGPKRCVGLREDTLKRHAAVIGPTGSGKTKSILVPWIATALRQGHSVVAVDVGGDLLDDLDVHRTQSGPLNASVARWDFSAPQRSISWNWIEDLQDDSAIIAAVEAIRGRPSPNDSQPFFHERDLRILRALIEMTRARRPGATAVDLLATLRQQWKLATLIAESAGLPAATRLPDLVGPANASRYPEMVSGAINALEVWDDPGLDLVTRRSTLRLEELFQKPSLLVVGAPIHAGRTSVAASSLMLSQIINRLYRRFDTRGGNHVFLVIDEAARLTDRLKFEELLSVSRRARASVVLATQDVGQFADENERLAILGNCATYISLPSRSKANADYLMGRLGERPESSVSLTTDPSHARSPVSSTRNFGLVPVLGAREILDPPWGERSGVVHCQPASGKPFLIDLLRAEFA